MRMWIRNSYKPFSCSYSLFLRLNYNRRLSFSTFWYLLSSSLYFACDCGRRHSLSTLSVFSYTNNGLTISLVRYRVLVALILLISLSILMGQWYSTSVTSRFRMNISLSLVLHLSNSSSSSPIFFTFCSSQLYFSINTLRSQENFARNALSEISASCRRCF